jgi:hypothetical protein
MSRRISLVAMVVLVLAVGIYFTVAGTPQSQSKSEVLSPVVPQAQVANEKVGPPPRPEEKGVICPHFCYSPGWQCKAVSACQEPGKCFYQLKRFTECITTDPVPPQYCGGCE